MDSGIDGRVDPRTETDDRIVLVHYTGTCRGWGMFVRIVLLECDSWWGVRSSDSVDIVTFLGGTRLGRCSRVMARGLEMWFLMVLTHSHSFADLGLSWDLSLGQVIDVNWCEGSLDGEMFR